MNGRSLISYLDQRRELKHHGYSIQEVESMMVWDKDLLIKTLRAEREDQQQLVGDGGYSQMLTEAIRRK